jgi:hypothetical protein
MIEGVQAHGARHTEVEGDDAHAPVRIDERWLSDDLAATVLEVHTIPKLGSETRTVLTHLNRTEPDPSLFEVPPGYTARAAMPTPAPRP